MDPNPVRQRLRMSVRISISYPQGYQVFLPVLIANVRPYTLKRGDEFGFTPHARHAYHAGFPVPKTTDETFAGDLNERESGPRHCLIMIIMASYRSEVPARGIRSRRPAAVNSFGLEYGALSTNGFDQAQYGIRSKIKLFNLGVERFPRGSGGNISQPPKTAISPRTCIT